MAVHDALPPVWLSMPHLYHITAVCTPLQRAHSCLAMHCGYTGDVKGAEGHPFVIVDEFESAWEVLNDGAPGRVDIILDNAGDEGRRHCMSVSI